MEKVIVPVLVVACGLSLFWQAVLGPLAIVILFGGLLNKYMR